MKFRLSLFLPFGILVAGCSGDTGEAAAETEAEAETIEAVAEAAPSAADEFEALRASFVEHYNMHHAAMVADFYAEDALTLGADGSVNIGKEAILASLEGAMEGSPTISITTGDTKDLGDVAMSHGSYRVETTAGEAGSVTITGYYMSGSRVVDGERKLGFVLTNYDDASPVGLPRVDSGTEPPPEESTMTEFIEAYETHFNLGHASMVADLFADDAVMAFSNLSLAEGRAAIEAALGERLETGQPVLDIHGVATNDLGNGWATDGGWYTLSDQEGNVLQGGSYALLLRQGDDGSWKIQWGISNGVPTG